MNCGLETLVFKMDLSDPLEHLNQRGELPYKKRAIYPAIKLMKKLTLLIFIFINYTSGLFAQSSKKLDTIYVICYQENLINKFYSVSSSTNKLTLGFFFKVDWELHGYKKDMFFVHYTSPDNKMTWVHNPIESHKFNLYKNVYNLEQFTKALNNNEFLIPIANGKVQIIMLYGEKCSIKFEMFPVKVGTDLYSEG